MTRKVFCVKLQKEADAMPRQMYPGELGKQIFENISNEAWQDWLRAQTILINEYRINPLDPKSREFLEKQMHEFFFGSGADLPDAFKPE
ncbi:oxidative damage protection protein [Ignatzschineria rhizosphaerae]|uniref:Probable Fe(2+)-trafficking protein n=1 Tax=Ignatzschineria rhizosphaerae TaxID=2923279 RepID=A0ABY3X1M0_9GAMM|nr:oxidative damage protection protein [Ignatzschineria rhizosphaerae]UNM96778.1 oxidative damage protection protein [Ignatzschineria rhizosphaerae]